MSARLDRVLCFLRNREDQDIIDLPARLPPYFTGMTMNLLDSDVLMKVEINGAIYRRPARVVVVDRGAHGLPIRHYTPELRPGEVLIETIDSSIPKIVRSGL